jgi:hypothetical protein
MANNEPPFLQTRAVMMYFQGTPWTDLIPVDFTILMRNPNFNDLEGPFRLPDEHYDYMYFKAHEAVSMWIDCTNHDYKPSDFRENNEILSEDLRAFNMLEKWKVDGDKYQAERERVEKENREYIEQEQAKFTNSRGRRR